MFLGQLLINVCLTGNYNKWLMVNTCTNKNTNKIYVPPLFLNVIPPMTDVVLQKQNLKLQKLLQ